MLQSNAQFKPQATWKDLCPFPHPVLQMPLILILPHLPGPTPLDCAASSGPCWGFGPSFQGSGTPLNEDRGMS
jgi:hypothetical protein